MPLRDQITVEATGLGNAATFSFDEFTSVRITNSVVKPAEASFEVGDVETYRELEALLALGAEFSVAVNGRPRLLGRMEARDAPIDIRNSGTMRFVVRTLLSDARATSATQSLSVQKVTLMDFLLRLFAPLGYTRESFDVRADLARDLLTGKSTRGGKPRADLDKIQLDAAKVKPPETIWECAVRHLMRHGLMIWDSPDGKIVVGVPDDQQAPDYYFRAWLTGPQRLNNNVNAINRAEDVTNAATSIGVFGVGGGKDYRKSKVSSEVVDQELLDAGFYRRMLFIDENVKTPEMAERRAKREMALRRRSRDALRVTVDTLSHDLGDGGAPTPYAPDTTADVVTEHLGGALGLYYVEEVTIFQDLSRAQGCEMTLVPEGVWVL